MFNNKTNLIVKLILKLTADRKGPHHQVFEISNVTFISIDTCDAGEAVSL